MLKEWSTRWSGSLDATISGESRGQSARSGDAGDERCACGCKQQVVGGLGFARGSIRDRRAAAKAGVSERQSADLPSERDQTLLAAETSQITGLTMPFVRCIDTFTFFFLEQTWSAILRSMSSYTAVL
jgi:hypothetical protein